MKKFTKVQAAKEAKLVAAKKKLAGAKKAVVKAIAKYEKPAVSKAKTLAGRGAKLTLVQSKAKPAPSTIDVNGKAKKPAAKASAKPTTAASVGPRIVKRAVPAVPPTKKHDGIEAHDVHEFVVAGLAAPVDPRDLFRTLGSGSFGGGQGLMDAWPTDMWEACLAHLGLPSDPLDRSVARFPVMRLVQAAWMREFGSPQEAAYPDTAAALAKDEAAKAAYLKAFDGVAKTADGRAAGVAKARATKGEAEYEPTAELKKQKVGGQAATLLAFLKAGKWAPTTTSKAAEGMVAHGLVTSTKPARIAAFYLCDWVKRGWMARS